MGERARPASLHVTIVSDKVETIERLTEYLGRAGVITNATRHIERAVEQSPEVTTAIVLFPDDFDAEQAALALAQLRLHRPRALRVVITGQPRKFALPDERHDEATVLVIPRPAWGWTILDAIRARLDRSSGSETR